MDNKADQTATWRNKQHRMRLECRECDVICQRVVHPWHCSHPTASTSTRTKTARRCISAASTSLSRRVRHGGLFRQRWPLAGQASPVEQRTGAPAKSELASRGAGRRRIKKSDPYGPVRVTRTPRPQCKVRVEQAYDSLSASCVCCNPTFFHDPFTDGHDAIKLTAMPPGDNVESQG